MRPRRIQLIKLAALFARHAQAGGGLQGYGLFQYDPLCAEACLRSLTSLALSCTEHGGSDHGHGGMVMMTTSPACRANDSAFLTSVSWCVSEKCAGVEVSKLEAFWRAWVTGSKSVVPKWTFSEALAEVRPRPPEYAVNSTDTSLNRTSAVNPMTYLMQWNVLGNVQNEMTIESTYGLILIAVAIGLPILMTLLGYMPFLPALYDRLRPYILYPSTIGSYSVRPLPFQLGNAPTVGQGLYLAIFVILNVVLTAVGYRTAQPSAWFSSTRQELIAYLLYRTGAFAFTLLPILLLFSSRNNLLLWMTNWSHPTYLLLHRWVGRLFTIHAVLHSIFGLLAYKHYEKTVWWAWGAVATVFSVVLWLGSGLYVRRKNYEVFLLVHIILSVLVLVGCWYHLILWYESMGMHVPSYTSGYEVWLYIAFGIWAFDRIIRVGRLLSAGINRSKVTQIGDEYFRVDIQGTRCSLEPGKHVYAYFPTLSLWRPWENHPFSIVPTALLQTQEASVASSPLPATSDKQDVEGMPQNSVRQVPASSDSKTSAAGVTLIIKKAKGITRYLQPDNSLLTLLEGPYASSHLGRVLRCDRVLLIGGGIGITSLLPWIRSHWNVKLAWSVKPSAQCLVDELEPSIGLLDQAQKDIRIGDRLDIAALVDEEVAAGWARVGVVVSGPGSLCDDVRAKVAAAGRVSKTVFELEVDAYSW